MEIAQSRPSAMTLAFQPLRDMVVFTGRSTRTEVVAFFLLGTLLNLVTIRIDGGALFVLVKLAWGFVWGFPWIALFVRRLHDQGRSGWWALLFAAPAILLLSLALLPEDPDGMSVTILGSLRHPTVSTASVSLMAAAFLSWAATLILFLLPEQVGANRFGPDPRDLTSS